MLLTADIEEKSVDNKPLFAGLTLSIEAGEKLAIIGRNGIGKTALFRMLTGEDKDYTGTVIRQHGLRMVATLQEHHTVYAQTALGYVLTNLPEYANLHHIIETYPETMGEDMRKIEVYSTALERFSQLAYHTVSDAVERSLRAYQISPDAPMETLSGGQRRLTELVRIEYSAADIALIDEPTNHMDYVAKRAFLEWFKSVKQAVVVITHDRDVLQEVSRIIEIRDLGALTFPGNYANYLKQNAQRTTNELNEYEVAQRRLENIKKQVQYARSKKSSWTGTADKKNPFVVMENRLLKELRELEAMTRPSFWIDQTSAANLHPKVKESYQKHKAKTIHIHHKSQTERQRDLLELDGITVGYTSPLFSPISQRICVGDRVHIVGRNGVGKSTLIRTIAMASAGKRSSTLMHGTLRLDSKVRMSIYEQEIDPNLLGLTVSEAIAHIYLLYGQQTSNEQIMRTLANYLFDPYNDKERLVRNLSGGQKARIQLIKLFANNPNLIILDEPTNHLDLPSIEELEAALDTYRGALLYISHDTYFGEHMGGDRLTLDPILRQV